jgi:hypothetical protein
MGSAAIDSFGNIALGYSITNSDNSNEVFPGIRYTGHRFDDPLGVMAQGEKIIRTGTNSQTGGFGNRWGDYSALSVDPVDDCTFWYTTHIAGVGGTGGRPTQIASFRFDNCGSVEPVTSLAFSPVVPCRIVDTRITGGAIPPGGLRSYNVRGAVVSQGGSSSGCPSPAGEPRAVHLNVAAVPVGGQGHLRLFPFNTPTPVAAILNYSTGAGNMSNAATVKTCYLCTKDVNVQSFGGTTHVVIDVMGYYFEKP